MCWHARWTIGAEVLPPWSPRVDCYDLWAGADRYQKRRSTPKLFRLQFDNFDHRDTGVRDSDLYAGKWTVVVSEEFWNHASWREYETVSYALHFVWNSGTQLVRLIVRVFAATAFSIMPYIYNKIYQALVLLLYEWLIKEKPIISTRNFTYTCV